MAMNIRSCHTRHRTPLNPHDAYEIKISLGAICSLTMAVTELEAAIVIARTRFLRLEFGANFLAVECVGSRLGSPAAGLGQHHRILSASGNLCDLVGDCWQSVPSGRVGSSGDADEPRHRI